MYLAVVWNVHHGTSVVTNQEILCVLLKITGVPIYGEWPMEILRTPGYITVFIGVTDQVDISTSLFPIKTQAIELDVSSHLEESSLLRSYFRSYLATLAWLFKSESRYPGFSAKSKFRYESLKSKFSLILFTYMEMI